MPSKAKCVSRLRKKYKDIDPKQLERIVDDVDNFQNAQRSLEIDPRSTLEEFIEEKTIAMAMERKKLSENIVKSKKVFERSLLDAFKDDPVEAVKAILGGTIRRAVGLLPSVDTISKGIERRHGIMLTQGLEEIGLWKVAVSGKLNREIMTEMFELRQGGKPGLSGSVEAQKIAGVFHRVQSSLLERLQAAGASVRYMDGYIMRQSHDPHIVFKAGYENWKASIEGKLDSKRTFGAAAGNTELENKILEDIYKEIKDDSWNQGLGQHIDDSLQSVVDTFKADRNVSKSRALHFKSSEAFHDYNKEWGRSDLLSSVHSSIIKTSRAAALIETFGTNPQAGLENLITKLKKHYKAVDPSIVDKMESSMNSIMGDFKQVRGDTSRAGNSMKAGFTRNALAIQRMRLLGNSLFTTMGDLAASAVTLRSTTGENLFSAHARAITSFISNIPDKAERIRVGKRLGIIVDDLLGATYSRHDSGGAPAGRLNDLQRLFFRLNGMTAQTIHGKTTMAKIFAGDLGDSSHLDFGSLNLRQQSNLGKYGIGDGEWKVMRQAIEDFSGEKLITPEAIRELGDDSFVSLKGERKISMKNLKEEVATKYQAYITDAVDDAIPTPGSREEAFFLRGLTEDSAWGAVARLVKQFKTVPLTLHRVHGRSAFSDPTSSANSWKDLLNFDNLTRLDKSTDMQNMFGFMVSATTLGYFALAATDIIKGRVPRDPFSIETFKEAFVKGGAGGLALDFGLADYDDSHRNFISDLAGPTLGGSIPEAFKSFASARDLWQEGREGSKVAGEALRLVGRHIPYQNLFWTRLGLDYGFLNTVNESLNPGYSRRFRNKINSEQGFIDILGVQPGDPTQGLFQ